MILYHGTTSEGMKKIPQEGFSLEAERTSDPGDFGWGVYLTGMPARAKAYGGINILRVEVDFDNPLKFSSVSEAYKWRELLVQKYGDTIHGIGNTWEEKAKSRAEIAKRWREELLRQGYDGIIIYDKRWTNGEPYEAVAFKPENIHVIEPGIRDLPLGTHITEHIT